jgi:hypothetical protein
MINPPKCFCGANTVYQDSKSYYHGTSYGMRYICERFPDCRGSVGAHPNGSPLGSVPDSVTSPLRIQCHSIIDPLWRYEDLRGKQRNEKRNSVYKWVGKIMGMDRKDCHVGMFSADQCRMFLERQAFFSYEQYLESKK